MLFFCSTIQDSDKLAGSVMNMLMVITENTIYAWVLFGSLGTIYWAYGKMKSWWQPRALGAALMIYPYFTSGDFWLWTVGGLLSVLIFFTRD